MRKATIGAAAVGFVVAVSVAVSASAGTSPSTGTSSAAPSPAEQIVIARQAFPTLQARQSGLARDLPTKSTADVAVAAARVSTREAGPSVIIAVTRNGEFCLVADGTGTCRNAEAAAATGLFVAEIDCRASVPVSKLTGVVPANVLSVKALGTGRDEPAVSPSATGVVSMSMAGTSLDGLILSDGARNPLAIDGVPCPPDTP